MDKDVAESLSFYAPLDGGLCAFGVGSTTPTFTNTGNLATYVSPTTGNITAGVTNTCRFEANGALIEGARTNNCLRSAALDNAAWVALNVTVTADSVASPDGGTNAEAVSCTTNGGSLTQVFVLGSAADTGSIYLKRVTGSGGVSISLDTVTWTAVAITSSWLRFTLTQTLANPTFGIKMATSGDVINAWGGQVEAGAFASSYIPTTSAAVTRNADILTYVAASNLPATGPGAMFGIVDTASAAVGQFSLIDTRNSSNQQGVDIFPTTNNPPRPRCEMYTTTSQANVFAGSAVDDFAANVPKRMGMSWATNDVRLYSSGISRGTPNVSSTLPASHTRIGIGVAGSGSIAPYGHISKCYVFLRAISSTEHARLQ